MAAPWAKPMISQGLIRPAWAEWSEAEAVTPLTFQNLLLLINEEPLTEWPLT